MLLSEPELIDETDGEEDATFSVAEYLAMWGCDYGSDRFPRHSGDGCAFYNYSHDGDDLEYLKERLLPAITRQLITENVPERHLMSELDTENFNKIKTYVEQKISAMEAGQSVSPVFREEETFEDGNCNVIHYSEIKDAVKDEEFTMTLSSHDLQVFKTAVNQGIDSRLQACWVPARGDLIQPGSNGRVKITLSKDSLPVLLRRLFENGGDTETSLASDIMASLGFNDRGEWHDPDDD